LCPNGFLSEKLKIGKFKIDLQWPKDKYKRDLLKYKKLLKNLVLDYFKNKKKQNYYKDFLPKVAEFIKSKTL
jgi:hypothetical protein